MNYGGTLPAHWVFNAHEGTPAKGTVFYEDVYGSYTADVVSVNVANSQDATFSATVTSSTYLYAAVGDTFMWTVHDLGEPGTSDYFTYLYSGGSIDLPHHGGQHPGPRLTAESSMRSGAPMCASDRPPFLLGGGDKLLARRRVWARKRRRGLSQRRSRIRVDGDEPGRIDTPSTAVALEPRSWSPGLNRA